MAAAARAITAAWTRHFFAAANEAVQQYICQVLLAAVEETGALLPQAELLAPYLPEGKSQQDLMQALAELDSALQPGAHPCFQWLSHPTAAGEAASSAVADHTAVDGMAHAARQAAHVPSSSRTPASGLSVAAAEFVPKQPQGAGLCNTADPSPTQQSVYTRLTPCSWQSPSMPTDNERMSPCDDGWCSSLGQESAGWLGDTAVASAVDTPCDTQRLSDNAAAQQAFLLLLGEQFPLFSDAALRPLFKEQGCSLAATLHVLCSLEAELQGQAAVAAADSRAAGRGAQGQPQLPAFTHDDFPELGGPAPGGQPAPPSKTAALPPSTAAAYAARARAAAHLPEPSLPGQQRGGKQVQQSSATPAAPAPIWQQREGVHRFITGAVLAQEYAELRSDARDHARLRNAYFQQATQAYLAGDRRLARELAAQGRWHAGEMQAAHQAASAELFRRHNPGAAAVMAGPGGGGVPTLDLHGLHVAEALQQLEEVMARRQAAGTAGRLRVVVGRGTHGRVPARLPAAVRRWLTDRGQPFSERYAGLLEIQC